MVTEWITESDSNRTINTSRSNYFLLIKTKLNRSLLTDIRTQSSLVPKFQKDRALGTVSEGGKRFVRNASLG